MRQSPTNEWFKANVKCAQNAELAHEKLNHPTMQKLRSAIQIVGDAMKDCEWAAANDKNGQLRQVLELLVRVTSLPPHR
jgi:hypothetical protein